MFVLPLLFGLFVSKHPHAFKSVHSMYLRDDPTLNAVLRYGGLYLLLRYTFFTVFRTKHFHIDEQSVISFSTDIFIPSFYSSSLVISERSTRRTSQMCPFPVQLQKPRTFQFNRFFYRFKVSRLWNSLPVVVFLFPPNLRGALTVKKKQKI